MENKLFFALILAVLFSAVFASQHWHSLSAKSDFLEFYLASFDSTAVSSQKSCFTVSFNSEKPVLVNFRAETGGNALFSEAFQINGLKAKQYCFNPSELTAGQNTILLSANNNVLFYHVDNGNSIGKKTIVLSADSAVQDYQIDWLKAFFGILCIALILGILYAIIPASFSSIQKACISIAGFSAMLVINFFALNLLGLANFFGIALLAASEIVLAFAFLKTRKKEQAFRKKPQFESFQDWIPFVIIIFTAVFFHFFTSTNLTYFNSFYERSTAVVTQNNGLALNDPTSYLGERPFAFIPGYFMLEASISQITGLQSEALFALMLAFAGLLFTFAVLFAAEAIGLEKHKGMLFLVLAANAFIFNFLIFTPRHLISFSLLLIAFAVLLRFKNWIAAGIILGIAGFVQVPLLLVFPLLCVFASRKIDFAGLAKSFIAGLAVFAVLFLPNFLKYGLPSFAAPEDWGYLLSLPFNFVFFDLAIPIFVLLIFSLRELYCTLRKNQSAGFSSFQKKLVIGIVLGIALEMLVSYRANVFTAFLIAVLAADWVLENQFWKQKEAIIAAFVLIAGFIFIMSFLPQAVIPSQLEKASEFLGQHSKASDNILADPFYGHTVEYLSQRKVLADLWVEYANSEKLNDSYNFLKTGRPEILEKYGIDFVINNKNTVFENAIGKNPTKLLEFPELNKVYDNGLVFVHQVPQ
ncbi:MAG: hypothetical protein Q7R70_06080 [Candidatus Diapherotrites archaeon]|nr:hypothetical protein [Candidatus Diapherotrites archaeon]